MSAPSVSSPGLSFPPPNFPTISTSSDLLDHVNRLRLYPFDTNALNSLLKALQNQSIDSARPYYEEIVRFYPSSGVIWLYWITHEIRSGSASNVETLFQRSLLKALDVQLWNLYIDHIETQNPISAPTADETPQDSQHREERIRAVNDCYEFIFKHFLHDYQVGSLYKRYLSFLKSKPVRNSYEESVKNSELRKSYQRIITIPCNYVEEFWREYDVFEHALNKTLAKSLLAEWQPKHLQAKSVARERKKKRLGINLGFFPVPPPKSGSANANATAGQSMDSDAFAGGIQGYKAQLAHAEQLSLWKRLIQYEATNPQRLSPQEARSRLYFHYRQAVNFMRHYPDLWLDFAHFIAEIPLHSDEATSVLREATLASLSNPASGPFMAFLWAEYEEERKNNPLAKQIYEDILAEYTRRADDPAELHRSVYSAAVPLIYIQFMRFCRRSEGPDAARKIFINCRKSPHCTWHAYVFAAEQELRCNAAPSIASKIYSFALQAFPNEETLKVKYLKFLAQTNDVNNYRVQMEKFCKTAETVELAAVGEWKKKRGGDAAASAAAGGLGWPNPVVLAKNLWDFGLSYTAPGADSSIVPGSGAGGRSEEFSGSPQLMLEDALQMVPSGVSSSGHMFHLAVEFERWTATDLLAIHRTEQRREAALSLQSPRTALAADRQRFLTLWPCSLEYRQVLQMSLKVASQQQLIGSGDTTHAAIQRGLKGLSKPDLSRLVPFHPHHHSVDSNRFRFVPPPMVKLIESLPGVDLFTGPRYSPDVVQFFVANPSGPLNEQSQLNWDALEAAFAPEPAAASATNGTADQADAVMDQGTNGATGGSAAATTDIYKLRQQQKHKVS